MASDGGEVDQHTYLYVFGDTNGSVSFTVAEHSSMWSFVIPYQHMWEVTHASHHLS